MTGALDTTSVRVGVIVLAAAIEAHASPLLDPVEAPCSLCGCALPAADPGECTRGQACPLEGRGR